MEVKYFYFPQKIAQTNRKSSNFSSALSSSIKKTLEFSQLIYAMRASQTHCIIYNLIYALEWCKAIFSLGGVVPEIKPLQTSASVSIKLY